MFKSDRPNTSPVMPGPLRPYWRRKRRPSQIDLAICRTFDSTMPRALGPHAMRQGVCSTRRLMANVLRDVTTGRPSASPSHWPQGATESAMR